MTSTKSASVSSRRPSVSLSMTPGPAGSRPGSSRSVSFLLRSPRTQSCQPVTGNSWHSARLHGRSCLAGYVSPQAEANQMEQFNSRTRLLDQEVDESPVCIKERSVFTVLLYFGKENSRSTQFQVLLSEHPYKGSTDSRHLLPTRSSRWL